MPLQLGDAAGGANAALFQLLKQRELERASRIEEELTRMRIEAARQDIEMRGKEMGLREREFLGKEGSALADQLAPGSFLTENDPAVATMQKSGRGSLLTPQDATMASRSITGFQSLPGAPVEAGTLTEEHPARPKGFLKTRSQKQIDTDADNRRQFLHEQLMAERYAQQDERARQQADDMAGYRSQMADIAQQNANANTMRAEREPQGRETFDEWQRKWDYQVSNPKPDGKPSTEAQQNEVEDAIALVDAIASDPSLNTSVGPLDAYIGKALGAVQGDLAGVTRFDNRHKELIGKLSLAQAGKLKGQGQISNYERQLLQNAATALNRNLSEKDYRAELQKIRAQFERMRSGGATASAPGKPTAADLIRKYGGG